MCPGERVDRSMNDDDLPIVAVLFKEQRIRSLKLTSCFVDNVVEAGPSGRVPVTDAKVRDGEFPAELRKECGSSKPRPPCDGRLHQTRWHPVRSSFESKLCPDY